ncbi:DLX1 protein, partial [Chionis minor]|nr:DLX1 protein [Chionis minor]
MTMTTMPESLNSPVSGKAVFMEFGPPSQQMSPSPMSHGHYSMHCLHSAGHSQPDGSYSTASSFSRPLGYPYVNSVSSHSTNPYISSVQSYPNSSSLTQTRLEETGGAALESSALTNGRALSGSSPPVPPVWNTTSASGKASSGTPGTYIPSYTSWYPSAHQEAMQQPQLM